MTTGEKRIAIISEHASPLAAPGGVDSGGQNVYVGQVARHLAAIGFSIDVFTRRDQAELPEILEWDCGVRIVHLAAGPAKYIRKEELLPLMPAFTQSMVDFIHRERVKYSLLHANFFMSGLAAAEIKRKLGIPFVITFHALGRVRRLHQREHDDFPNERFEIEDRVVAECDHMIAECPQDEDDLMRLYRADPIKITIIPCGFDAKEMHPIEKAEARAITGLPADEHIILQLGRVIPRKGIDNVIRGFSLLLREHKIPARLVIVGGESNLPDASQTPEIGALRSIAAAEGIEDRVLFTGRRGRDSLKFYYSAADVFVTTPWYEPFGITPVEAMACGTPVIGGNVGGIKFTVSDGETGFLVAPKDPAALAARMAELFEQPELMAFFRQRAIERANELFTWLKVAESIAGVYAEVLDAVQTASTVLNYEQAGNFSR